MITIRQGEVSTFGKGVIPEGRENWKDRQREGAEYVKEEIERLTEGEKIEREQMQRVWLL